MRVNINEVDFTVPSNEDEMMDMARYGCRIYHMAASFVPVIYDELELYAREVSGRLPYFEFLLPSDGIMLGYVYVFQNQKMLEKFIHENKNLLRLNKLTKNKSFYEN